MGTATAADYGYLRSLVQRHSQNVLDPSHDYLFEARLWRFLRDRGMSRLEELVQFLRARMDPGLERAIAEAMTINETSFFRDARAFDLLRTELLPPLIQRRHRERKLRFWSAGCSTGQEALSLAILLREHFPQVAPWDIRIEGTDICAQVVTRARAGRYHRIEINRGLPACYLAKYFDPAGSEWAVRREIAELCRFRHANLCARPLPFSENFDVVLLRNVIIYLSPEVRNRLLDKIHRLTAGDGVLLLGSSEQATDSRLWIPVLAGGTCYYKPGK